MKTSSRMLLLFVFALSLAVALVGCGGGDGQSSSASSAVTDVDAVSSVKSDKQAAAEATIQDNAKNAQKTSEQLQAEREAEAARQQAAAEEAARAAEEEAARAAEAEARAAEEAARGAEEAARLAEVANSGAADWELRAALNISEDYRASFNHGPKGAEFQKYIMLHDTESEASPESVVNYWDSAGARVAAHFIVGRDGHIVQCVPMDSIAHHAGFGDTGHNAAYGVEDESRDDRLGTTPIGSWASDYGMNSYSIGIEMVHVGGGSPYTEEQLAAVDALIAYIDAYYGFQSTIVDHKAWRPGNSDTSPEFAGHLANYQAYRRH